MPSAQDRYMDFGRRWLGKNHLWSKALMTEALEDLGALVEEVRSETRSATLDEVSQALARPSVRGHADGG